MQNDWNCVTCLCSLQEMLGLGGSGRGQQPQMRGGPVPPQQQQPGGDSFNRYAVLSIIRKQYSKQNNGFYYTKGVSPTCFCHVPGFVNSIGTVPKP